MGTHYNGLIKAVLASTHDLCFEQKYVKYRNFLSENFHFLVVKFSVYLNRHVFVMDINVYAKFEKHPSKTIQIREQKPSTKKRERWTHTQKGKHNTPTISHCGV